MLFEILKRANNFLWDRCQKLPRFWKLYQKWPQRFENITNDHTCFLTGRLWLYYEWKHNKQNLEFNTHPQNITLLQKHHVIINKMIFQKCDGGPRGSTHGEWEGGLTPFILLPRTLLLPAPPLLAPRCAAKLYGCAAKVLYAAQLPRRSSSRVCAVMRDEREGEERGKLEPRSFRVTGNQTQLTQLNMCVNSFPLIIVLIIWWKSLCGHFLIFSNLSGHFWYFPQLFIIARKCPNYFIFSQEWPVPSFFTRG